MSNKETLIVENLVKRIGKKTIIKGVSFSLQKGEVFGFLGPNGAGKTTTIRMLVGLIRPTKGRISICGQDLEKDFTKAIKHIGCIVENPELYPYLTGRENLEHFVRMVPSISPLRINEVVELVGLQNRIDDRVSTYSLGMRQRLGIAQALLGKPDVLILDEPTNGLDPVGIREMREFIRSLAEKEGLSVLVSSHLLSEIQLMCDRVAIMSKGEIIKVDTVQQLLSERERMVWEVEPKEEAYALLREEVNVTEDENGKLLTPLYKNKIPEWNEKLVSSGITVKEMSPKLPTLEDLFIELTGGRPLINLIFNEMIKISRKRKLLIISAIVAVLVAMFTYAQFREIQRITERLGTTDWRAQLQQDIIDAENRLNSSSMSDEYKEYLRTLIDQQKFYLEQNINPQAPGAPTFIRIFLENAIDLFIPLLVMVIAADLVSSEASGGTIKLLLTRPVKRSRILLSKLLAMILSVSLIVWIVILLSYLISGIVLGYGGWNLPILSGFESVNGELSTQNVHLIPQWQYILMEAGLVWFVAIIVGSLTFMLSVIMRSTAAVMGIILASLISGVILSNTISSWESAKYLFMINLRLTDYLRGFAPPIEGMTLGFSISVLAAWGATAIFIAFYSFTRKDVY